MRNRGQIILGILLNILGVMILAGYLLNFDPWKIFWPVALMLIGLWLIFRPRVEFAKEVNIRPIGDIRRYGEWQVADEEIWTFVGDVNLDMTQAEIPTGETCIRILGFVGDYDLVLPKEIGFTLASTAFVSSLTVMGKKREVIFTTANYKSEDYETAERKVRLELTCFVAEVNVRQA
jgi:predicted membrane protein